MYSIAPIMYSIASIMYSIAPIMYSIAPIMYSHSTVVGKKLKGNKAVMISLIILQKQNV
jgi:hypothetical protein